MKFKKIQHTILMKFGRSLAIIVHYAIEFNLECCKSSVPDMMPYYYFKYLKNISKRRLKNEIKNFQPTIHMKFGRPLAIIFHYTVQFNLECCKSCAPDMGPNTILKIKKISSDVLKVKLKKFQHTIIMKFGRPHAIMVYYTV